MKSCLFLLLLVFGASALSSAQPHAEGSLVMDEKMTVLDAIPYYLNPSLLRDISIYYGDSIFKTSSRNDYVAQGRSK